MGNRNTVYDSLNSVTYAYNLANEYTKVTTGTSLPGSENYFYDIRGNLSRDDGFDGDSDDAFVYDYDPENRLTQVRYDPGTGTLTLMATYRYDASGRRIEYLDPVRGVTCRYYHDSSNMIAEYDQAGQMSPEGGAPHRRTVDAEHGARLGRSRAGCEQDLGQSPSLSDGQGPRFVAHARFQGDLEPAPRQHQRSPFNATLRNVLMSAEVCEGYAFRT